MVRPGGRWGMQNQYPVQNQYMMAQGPGVYQNRMGRPQNQQGGPRGPPQQYNQVAQGGVRMQGPPRTQNPGVQQQNVPRPPQQQQQQRPAPTGPKAPPQPYQAYQQRPQGIVIGGQEPLTSAMLAAAAPQVSLLCFAILNFMIHLFRSKSNFLVSVSTLSLRNSTRDTRTQEKSQE